MTRLEHIAQILEEYSEREAVLLNAHINGIAIYILDGEFVIPVSGSNRVWAATKEDLKTMLDCTSAWIGIVGPTKTMPYLDNFGDKLVHWVWL